MHKHSLFSCAEAPATKRGCNGTALAGSANSSPHYRLYSESNRPRSASKHIVEDMQRRQQQERAECTFQPAVNHTHDRELDEWAGGVDVFSRLYGHAVLRHYETSVKATLSSQLDPLSNEAPHSLKRASRGASQRRFPAHLLTQKKDVCNCAQYDAERCRGGVPPSARPTINSITSIAYLHRLPKQLQRPRVEV